VNDPAVWLAYARVALTGQLKGAELAAELERVRYDDGQPRLLEVERETEHS
jgi:hypothetical protein